MIHPTQQANNALIKFFVDETEFLETVQTYINYYNQVKNKPHWMRSMVRPMKGGKIIFYGEQWN